MDLFLILVCLVWIRVTSSDESVEEREYGVKYATDCEVCKYFVSELVDRLEETGLSHEVLETGYTFDPSKKRKTKYVKSELRLLESLEGVCDRLLQYSLHKERKDSTRFAKGMSETFKTLHGLVEKGVKVELGMPEDLWDKPSAEVTHLKTQCEHMLERFEPVIETWYWNHMDDETLHKYLCVDRVLKKGDAGCLDEKYQPPEVSKDEPEVSKDEPEVSKDEPEVSKDGSEVSKDGSEVSKDEL